MLRKDRYLLVIVLALMVSLGCKHPPHASARNDHDAAPPAEPPAAPSFTQPLSAEERMAMMSRFAWAHGPPEPESDPRVMGDTESVCGRAKKRNFNSWGQLGVFSKRWLRILYRMEIPDRVISDAARCEATELMRQAGRRRPSQCTEALVTSLHFCDPLLDAGSPTQ